MKTKLTKEQSQHLIDLGVPKEKASGAISVAPMGYDVRGVVKVPAQPVFKLKDFLNGEILPKVIRKGGYFLTIYGNVVGYAFDVEYEGLIWDVSFENEEQLIDALYKLACWYYGEYLKREER